MIGKRTVFAGLALLATSFPMLSVGMAQAETPDDPDRTLVYCSEGSPNTLNPQLTTSGTAVNATKPIFESLVALDAKGRIVPKLATSWTISDDGLVYTFHLRPGVRFHAQDGFHPSRTMNADDVVFSLARQWKTDHPYHPISGANYQYFSDMGLRPLLKAVEKVDELTVRIVLNRPEAPLLADLSMEFASVLSAEYADYQMRRGKPEAFDSEPVGTGPFAFVSYAPDVAIRYRAFDGYWGGRRPIDSLVFSIVPSAGVRLNQLKIGECHVMAFPNLSDLDKIKADPNLGLIDQDGLSTAYLAFNTARKPFDDPRVRRAFVLAVDRHTLVDAIFHGTAIPAKNPIPPGIWSYADDIPDYPYDPVTARRLLIEAGYPDGVDVDIGYMPVARPYMPDSKRASEMMAADLAKVGIRARLFTEEWKIYLHRDPSGSYYNAGMVGWGSNNDDPDNFLALILGCENGKASTDNLSRWCDRDFNELISKAKITSDQAVRSALYHQAQEVFHRELPWMPIAHSRTYAAYRKEVRGFHLDVLGRYVFGDAEFVK